MNQIYHVEGDGAESSNSVQDEIWQDHDNGNEISVNCLQMMVMLMTVILLQLSLKKELKHQSPDDEEIEVIKSLRTQKLTKGLS